MSAGNLPVGNQTRRLAPPYQRKVMKALPVELVTLPSGRKVDLHRARWNGVLDHEEYEYCQQHGIAVGYDCAQIGWVPLTVKDELADQTEHATQLGPNAPLKSLGAEQRALELRRQLDSEARTLQTEVRAQKLSSEDALERLEELAATAMQHFAAEYNLSDCDLCHWGLRSIVADFVHAVQGPSRVRPLKSDSTAFDFRSWAAEDAEVYAELLGNPRVWQYLPEPFPAEFTTETARTLIEVGAIGFHHDAVAIEVDGQPIGQCVLRFDRPFSGTRASEVAYWLGEEHWGKGWMSRVLPAFTDRSFRQHAIDVIYAWIMEDNKGSIRVAERAGYRRVPFALEAQIAESLRRPGFIRYATYRVDWLVDANQAS